MLACILGLGMKIPQSIQISTTSQALPWLTLNDLTIGWQNFNRLSATLVLQARQARASGENLNYTTFAPEARKARPSGEILNYSLSH